MKFTLTITLPASPHAHTPAFYLEGALRRLASDFHNLHQREAQPISGALEMDGAEVVWQVEEGDGVGPG